MKKLVSLISVVLCFSIFLMLVPQMSVLAQSVEMKSRYMGATIDGKASSAEWSGAPTVQIPDGFLSVQNNLDYLYILVDVTADTYNDPLSAGAEDFFWLTFDTNFDHLITPNVDFQYSQFPGTYNLGRQYYLDAGMWTGLGSCVSTFKAGFGTSLKSTTSHRIWEISINLKEIKATPGGIVRLGLKTSSHTPSFDDDFPENFYLDFSDLVEVSLATVPSYFYVVSNSGVIRINSAGTKTTLINAYQTSYSIYTLGDMLQVSSQSSGGNIKIHNFAGSLLNTITRPSVASNYRELTALPLGRFALSDNFNDKVYFINSAGTLLATANIRDTPDTTLQNLCGIVVGNKLVLSEDGQKRIVQFDLSTYARTVLRDLSGLSASWIGSIAYANGRYYVCTSQSIYSFTSSTSALTKVADVPGYNIVGIGVLDACYAYVAVNFNATIYRVNLWSGASSVLASGLNYPKDMAATLGTKASLSDGFESGSFSKWTSYSWTPGETDTVVFNSTRRAGLYSARFRSNGTYGFEVAYCQKTISETSDIYVRGYFYLSSGIGNGSVKFIDLMAASGSSVAYVGLKMNTMTGALNWFFNLRNGSSYLPSDGLSSYLGPHAGHWYSVELHWHYANPSGYLTVWINGVAIGSIAYGNTARYGGITSVKFGMTELYNCPSTTVYADCARISTTYVGTTPYP